MDFVKNAMSGGNQRENNNQQGQSAQSSEQNSAGGGFLGGISDKLNSAAGGGKESEKNEDYLDKGQQHLIFLLKPLQLLTATFGVGVDAVQQYGLGQGPQDNESAVEQAKDEQISDFIRGKYKSTTGKDIPIEDKKTTFG